MATVERQPLIDAPGLTPEAELLSRLLSERSSCRAFRSEPVGRTAIETMLALAQNAASWCNTQPWQVHVTTGEATERFRQAFYNQALKESAEGGLRPQSDLDLPAAYTGAYKERQREVGWQLYSAVGVAFGDREGSGKQMLENYRMFGAPHALIITTERDLGTYGVLDCGSYLGTLIMVAQSMGIGLVPQAAFAVYCPLIREFFDIPDNRAIVCGASFGYPDLDHPANSFRSRRAPVSDVVSWMDK